MFNFNSLHMQVLIASSLRPIALPHK